MIRAAIVEDVLEEAEALKSLLSRYEQEEGVAVDVRIFDKPLAFLGSYKANYDVIFLDIEMPSCNGLEVAEGVRMSDNTVIIVFVTHMAQYAANGYKVDATDYIVKPVTYRDFLAMMKRVSRRLSVKQQQMHTISSMNGISRVDVSEIVYVEVARHRLFYHMVSGETWEAWGTLSRLEEELPRDRFARCNSCYLVNLQFVRGVKGDFVLIGKESLHISRSKKQEFISALVAFTGE